MCYNVSTFATSPSLVDVRGGLPAAHCLQKPVSSLYDALGVASPGALVFLGISIPPTLQPAYQASAETHRGPYTKRFAELHHRETAHMREFIRFRLRNPQDFLDVFHRQHR